MTSILVVDDESACLDSVTRVLRIEGFDDVMTVQDSREVPPLLERRSFDLALLDITMPNIDGIELLKTIKEVSPQTECIMLTANDSIPSVIKSIRYGAYDYLLKPLSPDQLLQSMDRALERRRLVESLMLRSARAVSRSLNKPEAFSRILTRSDNMIRLLHEAELHAASNIPILITGETGVGKELLASALHGASRRARGPFVPVNMLALSQNLFESEFFGHVKGAFTGADRDKKGYLGKATGGTLFLDEIGDLQMEIQGKLLRILQEGEYTPVGRTRSETADVRFVAATNQDLEKLVEEKRFRMDLFYRLQFAHLHLPPLRERVRDIPILAASFVEATQGPGTSLSEEAEAMLCEHSWPGNVRELRGVLEAASNLAEKGTILPEHIRLPNLARGDRVGEAPAPYGGKPDGELEPLAEVERKHILRVYEAVGRNKTHAAKVLEVGLQTLHRKLKSYKAQDE